MRNLRGKLLGCGRERSVWEHRENPEWAIKMSHRTHDGKSNREEYWLWHNAPENVKKWLVPVVEISDCGLYMTVFKGEAVKAKDVPKGLPAGFVDARKALNWVKVKDKVLLADYHSYDKSCLF